MDAGRAWLSGAAGIAALWMATSSPRAQQPPPIAPSGRPHFRTAVRLTTVTATVTDTDGHLVRGLPRDEFEVFEDGAAQAITQFTSDRVPLSLGILLDASDSMYGRRIADARGAIDYFVADLLDPADEFSLLVFNHRQQMLTTWTDDRTLPLPLLTPVKPWGSTAIYDAIMAALPLADSRHRQRAALLVVSDGADTASDTGLRDLRAALMRTDLFVYAVGIDPADRRAINAPVNAATLGQITDRSGGRTSIVHDSSEISLALEHIADELNSQYLIGYASPREPDGQYHSIRVRVRGGALKVRARNGYVG
ncbi:MAG TPA: VWA domain-containing protein [Vicinamibacterales bacterium]|nr:VWA domain-containing protein [Vicinamibacterales bacterium]